MPIRRSLSQGFLVRRSKKCTGQQHSWTTERKSIFLAWNRSLIDYLFQMVNMMFTSSWSISWKELPEKQSIQLSLRKTNKQWWVQLISFQPNQKSLWDVLEWWPILSSNVRRVMSPRLWTIISSWTLTNLRSAKKETMTLFLRTWYTISSTRKRSSNVARGANKTSWESSKEDFVYTQRPSWLS